MSSYNQTRTIMEELKSKIKSASATPNKKVFVVVLEGTESEFDEIRKLGGVEIEDMNALTGISNISTTIKSKNRLNDMNLGSNFISNKSSDKSIYVNTGSVITEGDIARLSEETKEIILKERGMITPLARDLAKKLGIKVTRVKA